MYSSINKVQNQGTKKEPRLKEFKCFDVHFQASVTQLPMIAGNVDVEKSNFAMCFAKCNVGFDA